MRDTETANLVSPAPARRAGPSATFYDLLDDAVGEIRRRDPTYLSRFPVSPLNASQMSLRYSRHPLCAGVDVAAIEGALVEGVRYFTKSGLMASHAVGGSDAVARLLFDSIVDAACADWGILPLQAGPKGEKSASHILAADYSERRTPAGQRYFVRNQGTRPLLLVNALGVPIDIWWRFLADGDHGFKTIVVERPSGDLFAGGIAQDVDIAAESDGLAAVLRAESLGPASVVAWCSGARVAIDLAARYAERVAALMLVAPSLLGIAGMKPDPSQFEKDFRLVANTIGKRPELTAAVARTFCEPPPVIWDDLRDAAAQRAETLFGLPARARSAVLTTPMSEPNSLTKLTHRLSADESHATDQALAALTIPIINLVGENDRIIHPPFAALALKTWAKSVVQVTLTGAGHYVHDLQYQYFRLLLTEFLGKGRVPTPSARILLG